MHVLETSHETMNLKTNIEYNISTTLYSQKTKCWKLKIILALNSYKLFIYPAYIVKMPTMIDISKFMSRIF